MTDSKSPLRIVVMGVSGVGKTVVGSALADRVGAEFMDADTLHPPANILKMATGIPLDDADRMPWLLEIARQLRSHSRIIIACSALKASYRQVFTEGAEGLMFICLSAPEEIVAQRLVERVDHFMPPSLLRSQILTLEPLRPQENGFTVDASLSVQQLLTEILDQVAA